MKLDGAERFALTAWLGGFCIGYLAGIGTVLLVRFLFWR